MRGKTIFKELERTLELDEVLVYPNLYELNPELYSEKSGKVLLVTTNPDEPDAYSWIWPSELERAFQTCPRVTVVEDLYLCRLYDKGQDDFGYLISREEYSVAPDSYVVLKTVVVVAMKDFPHYTEMIELSDYEERKDELDLIAVSYFVRPS